MSMLHVVGYVTAHTGLPLVVAGTPYQVRGPIALSRDIGFTCRNTNLFRPANITMGLWGL